MPSTRASVVTAFIAGASIAALAVSASRFNTVLSTLSELQERSYAIAVELAQLRQEVAQRGSQPAPTEPKDLSAQEALAWLRTPQLPGLEAHQVAGHTVKRQSFDLNAEADPMRLRDVRAPAGWKPDPTNPEGSLPFAWSQLYVEKFKQNFNADTLLVNSAAIANWIKAGGSKEEAGPLVDLMLQRLSEYVTKTANGGHLVTYRFDYSFHDQILQSGWVSAYGNAAALAGLVYLARELDDPRLMGEAGRLFRGLSTFKAPKWVTYIDERQFTWFEEYPLEGPRKAHVFNGHIWATFALFEYYRSTGSSDAKTLVDAGLTTVKRYFAEFRFPGRVSRYDLYASYNPDYAPWHIINLQRALFDLTADETFQSFERQLLTDMAYDPPPDSTRPGLR